MQGIRRFGGRSAGGLALLAAAVLCVPGPTPAQPPEPAPAPRPVGVPAPAPPPATAGLRAELYLKPPAPVLDAVLATRSEPVTLTNLSPDGRKFLVARRDALPSVDRLARPDAHLAELDLDPVAGRARGLWVASAEAFDLIFPAGNRTVAVKAPAGARVASPAWSPDGSRVAFLALFPDATVVCVADAETGACRQLTRTPVLATLVTTLNWTADGRRVLAVLAPSGRPPVTAPAVAPGPKVRVARDGLDPSRTYRYLLESPYHADLLEHLLTGQLAAIEVADGAVTPIGRPAMIRSVSPSPTGEHVRVATVKKPFSYYAPFQRFGTTESIWDATGRSLVTLSDRNLREAEPSPPGSTGKPDLPTTGGGVKGGRGGRTQAPVPQPAPLNPDAPPTPVAPAPFDPDGRRDLAWRPDGKGLSYLQLEPVKAAEPAKGGAKKDAAKKGGPPGPRKDRVMQWLPPFGPDDTRAVYESATRIMGVQYSADARWLFVSQTVDGQRQITAVDLAHPPATYVVSRGPAGFAPKAGETPKKDGGGDDDGFATEQRPGPRAGDAAGGAGLMARPAGAATAARVSAAGDVYLTGTEPARGPGTFPRPFVEAVRITTGKRARVFTGTGAALETIDAVDGDDVARVFTTRQTADVVPDSFVTDRATGAATKLTANVDRAPWFRRLKTERIRVTRADGFKFWVKVTRPPDAAGKLPALFWIYPREYADQAAYDATAGRAGSGTGPTAGRFVSPGPRSVAILTLAGYAVVEPDVPVVGPAGRMNDNYVPDLRNTLWATIDALDKRGLIDRDRLACGGHSYGAFSTANALAHTPFFKAGIAGDGCYNRTLTSMTFQSERRLLWDARETYLEMSPLLWANRVTGALLLYHGLEDANVGTHPMNSEALFAALDGLGKDAALYMYPYEGHGPIARETHLDLWARWVAWLDRYVKDPKPR